MNLQKLFNSCGFSWPGGVVLFIGALLLTLVSSGCGQKENSFETFTDSTVIGSTTFRMITFYDDIATSEQGVGDMVADAMLWKGINAEIALINAGSIRRRGVTDVTYIEKGNITINNITLLFPFDNPSASAPATITMISLTGAVLKEVFENSFSRMQSDGEPGTSFGRFLQVSGVKVYADLTLPVNSRITKLILSETGEEIDLTDSSKTYRTAIPLKYIKDTPGYRDFDAYWDIFTKGTDIVDTEVLIYDATVEFIQTYSPLTYDADINASGKSYRIFRTYNAPL